jgi:hypothetical protein
MWHAPCMQGSQGDVQLLLIGSQIGNLTPNPSFGHILCFKYPNGSCKLILCIYVPRAFPWYKEIVNPMDFDACNHSLKSQEFIKSPTPKMKVHLGVWSFIVSHSLTFPEAWNVTLRLHSWPTPLQALALVVSPRLGLRHKVCCNVALETHCYMFVHRYKLLMLHCMRQCFLDIIKLWSNLLYPIAINVCMCNFKIRFGCWFWMSHACFVWDHVNLNFQCMCAMLAQNVGVYILLCKTEVACQWSKYC